MVRNYNEHPIERDIPAPDRSKGRAGTGRNQRLAAQMQVGDSVLVQEGRANALVQCIKKLGGKAVTEDAGMLVNLDTVKWNKQRVVPHKRVWRVA